MRDGGVPKMLLLLVGDGWVMGFPNKLVGGLVSEEVLGMLGNKEIDGGWLFSGSYEGVTFCCAVPGNFSYLSRPVLGASLGNKLLCSTF